MARPRYLDALTASFRATAPALVGFQGFAFLRGGMTALAPPSGDRVVTCARVVSSIRCDRSDVLIGRDLTQQPGQHGRITYIAGRDLNRPDLQRFFIDPDVYLAPNAPLRAAPCPAGYCAAMPERG